MKSKFGSLDKKDVLRSIALAVISAVLTYIVQLLNKKGFDLTLTDLTAIGEVALTTLVAYLSKNVFTNSDDEFGKKETS